MLHSWEIDYMMPLSFKWAHIYAMFCQNWSGFSSLNCRKSDQIIKKLHLLSSHMRTQHQWNPHPPSKCHGCVDCFPWNVSYFFLHIVSFSIDDFIFLMKFELKTTPTFWCRKIRKNKIYNVNWRRATLQFCGRSLTFSDMNRSKF